MMTFDPTSSKETAEPVDIAPTNGQPPTLEIDVAAQFTASESVFEIDVPLEIPSGETLVVLGPSGSGKSLLLETVAGFHPHEGQITLNETDLTDVAPEDRGFGFVFQDHALFPHMTVQENVAFGQQYHQRNADGQLPDPETLLSRFGISHLTSRSPRTLSGGEKQRVALARALAIRPQAMLLDEPLSALDVPTRESLRNDLADSIADVTALYVTHNRTTARALADRVAIMRNGQVVQVGNVEDVFERPVSPFVARFTGANCLPATAVGDENAEYVAIRPEHVQLNSGGNAHVIRVTREDATTRVTLDAGDYEIIAFVTDPPAVGETVNVELPRQYCSPIYDEQSTTNTAATVQNMKSNN